MASGIESRTSMTSAEPGTLDTSVELQIGLGGDESAGLMRCKCGFEGLQGAMTSLNIAVLD